MRLCISVVLLIYNFYMEKQGENYNFVPVQKLKKIENRFKILHVGQIKVPVRSKASEGMNSRVPKGIACPLTNTNRIDIIMSLLPTFRKFIILVLREVPFHLHISCVSLIYSASETSGRVSGNKFTIRVLWIVRFLICSVAKPLCCKNIVELYGRVWKSLWGWISFFWLSSMFPLTINNHARH